MQIPNHQQGESIPTNSKTSHSFFKSPLSDKTFAPKADDKLPDSPGAFLYMIRDRPLPIDELRREYGNGET